MPLGFLEHIDLDILKVLTVSIGSVLLSMINWGLEDIEGFLKICLLGVSFFYTVWKWKRDHTKAKKKDKQ